MAVTTWPPNTPTPARATRHDDPRHRVTEVNRIMPAAISLASSVSAVSTRGVTRGRTSRRASVAAVAVRAQQHGEAQGTGGASRMSPAPSEDVVMPRRRLINLAAATTALVVSGPARADEFANDAAMALLNRQGKVRFTDAEWKAKLEPFAYEVLRHEATERPFSSPLYTEKRPGTFLCAGCGSPLFDMKNKYDSGTGWPSFDAPVDAKAVTEVPDYSIVFLPRTEVRCATCQGHLGHVFNDGPRDTTGLRYCMNGVSLKFEPAA